MQTGIARSPSRYAPLTRNSSFEDFQEHLHGSSRYSGLCPMPCATGNSSAERPTAQPGDSVQAGCRTSVEGDACYGRVMWAMRTGIVEQPDWYLPLTRSSTFEEFQEHLHGVARHASSCPKPCAAQQRPAGSVEAPPRG
ncbi:unnamed protein product [Prorocentrum cordatum]|uniref:Uncharacterized protein n=1 Tax=Prorocentrum cordatum TaxID=2364126 RepID=A0ABN9Q2S3_9DINO|nr:unnamed protein product [Polarella glacialis]